MKNCVFCAGPEIREREIFRDNLVFAFPTNIPITPGHTLVAPIRCVSSFDGLTDKELRAFFALRQRIAEALRRAFRAEGFNYAWNEGVAASQNIPHLHLHIVPRRAGDRGSLGYDPRTFLYRPGPRKVSVEQELLKISARVKKELAA